MSKHLVLGNGSVLVGLDEYARIKDLYYDYVGLENHLTPEAVCKIGIWVEDQFSWFDDGSWQFRIDDLRNSLTEIFEAISDNDTLNAKGEGKSSLSRLFNKEEGYEEERARILAVKAEYFSVDKESFGPTEKGAKVLAAISEVRKNDIGNMSMMLRRDDRETYDKNVSRSLALAQAENFISKGLRI